MGLLLNRREIVKKIRAWILVVLVMPHEAAKRMGRDPKTNGRTFNEVENCFRRR
jgi:hypothetical protein